MQAPIGPTRLGALALALSAFLFLAFPLVRPFFDAPPSPSANLTVVAEALSSPAWVVSHLIAMVAFILLIFGLLTLYVHLAHGRAERRALWGLVFGLTGIGLILPVVGSEAFALKAVGDQMLVQNKTELVDVVTAIRAGPGTIVLILGLLFLAIGAILFARAIWQSDSLPKWGGVFFAVGLALFVPFLPQAIRIADGLLIGIGGIWIAWTIWQQTSMAPTTTAVPA